MLPTEAMRVYSGRQFQTEKEREAVVGCHRLFALTQRWGGPSPRGWATLVDLVSNHPAMEAETRLQVLSGSSRGRLPRDLEAQQLEPRSGKKGYRQGLKRLQETDAEPSAVKRELLESELKQTEPN
jgi:hypothetical protein